MSAARAPWMVLGRLAGLVAAIAMAGSALAQTSLDDPLDDHSAKRLDRMEKVMRELRAIVFQGRETGQPVVVQPADTDRQIAGLSDKLADVQQSLSRVNGQLEVLTHDLDQTRHEALDLRAANGALKTQVADLEQKLAAAAAPPPAPPVPVVTADPASAFAAAKAAFAAGDMNASEAGFRDFVDRYGDGPRGAEARYYLAKTLIARRAWPEAATADIGAIRDWPKTRWAPDAVLDLSRALKAMNKTDDACQTLGELTKRYLVLSAAVKRGVSETRARAKCG